MPRMKTVFERKGILAVAKSKLRAAFRVGIRLAAVHWWVTYLPGHFTEGAIARYHYHQRKAKYNALKRREGEIRGVKAIGDTSPMVFTGHSREVATTVQNIKAIATSSEKVRAEVVINAPALNFRYSGSKINMREEVTMLLVSETTELQDIYGNESQEELKRLGVGETIIKRIAA